MKERILIERLLDTVVTRMRHAQRRTETRDDQWELTL